jgi:hypothetical protein
MKHVLHAEDETIHDLIDGKLYSIPPNEVFEIENDHHADLLLQHKHYHGIVLIEGKKGPRGTTFDFEQATADAKEKLAAKELETVQAYVAAQMEDKVSKGLPARPPEGRVARIIKKLKIDLARDYNLQVLGQPTSAKQVHDDTQRQLKEERERNDKLQADFTKLQEQMTAILANQQAATGQNKPAESEKKSESAQQKRS